MIGHRFIHTYIYIYNMLTIKVFNVDTETPKIVIFINK